MLVKPHRVILVLEIVKSMQSLSQQELDNLEQHEDKVARLHFDDGEVVEAWIVSVDTTEHDDVIYHLQKVLHPSATRLSKPGDTYIAPVSSLVGWESVT